MKYFISCFFLLFLSVVGVSAQTLSNIDFFAEGKKVVITYDLSDCQPGEYYDVTLNFVEQSTLKVTVPKTISGDVKKLTCGSKRIVWDIGADISTLSGRFYPELEVVKVKKNSIDLEFVDIPAGAFVMGSPITEVARGSDEQQHIVTLSAFKMSKNEITFAQYDSFCDETKRTKPRDEGWGRGERPVINVTWHDAKAFADWMGCRLPTEAEWEYACRSGTTTKFNVGDNLTMNLANFDGDDSYNESLSKGYLKKTQLVGSYLPNGWGLNDMHGNVLEWCSDWYDNYSKGFQSNPLGKSYGLDRVIRGGGWFSTARFCRSSFRNHNNPSYSYHTLGFRLVAP